MKKSAIVISFLILGIFFASPVSASADTKAGIKPGSFFYFFDTTFEKIGLFFAFSPEKKAQKALEYADERLAEIQAIEEEKNPDAIKAAITNYESNVALATEKSKEVKDKGQAENLLTLITNNASKNQEVLSAILIKVPDEAKEAITKAIEVSKKGQEEATKQITELKSEVEQLKQELADLKAKDEKREKAIEELSKQKSETASKATPTRTRVEDTSALKSEATSQNGASKQVKKPDNNTTTVAENFSSATASALLSQAKSYQDLIDFADGAIQYVDISLDELATLIAKNEGYVSVLGPENSKISQALIAVYREDVSNSNSYKTQLISHRDTAKNNVSIYKNAAMVTTSKFVGLQEFISTTETLKNDTNWSLSKDYLFKTYENYVTYRKNKDNFYVKTDAELRALYITMTKDTQPSTPTYQPQVAPQFQVPQLPRTTSCTLSGDGGVGLQAYMNCITY